MSRAGTHSKLQLQNSSPFLTDVYNAALLEDGAGDFFGNGR
jgi:hypothetical protein